MAKYISIANLVYGTREKFGLSHEFFGILFGVTRQTVAAWEKGNSEPRRDTVEMIKALATIKRPPDPEDVRRELILNGPAYAWRVLLNALE